MGGNCSVAAACSAHLGVGALVPLAAVPQAAGGLPALPRKQPPAQVVLATGGVPKAAGGFSTRHCERPPVHVVLAACGIP